MTSRAWGLAVMSIGLLSTEALAAQGTTPCVAVLDHADTGRRMQGGVRQYASGDVRAHCDGQETSMASDSIAWLRAQGRFEMVGNARFRDTTVTLDADRAVYFLDDERLEAYGNVRLVNRASGTVLTGPNLTYYRSVPALRDTTELYATHRPTVEYRADGESADAEPYIILGDRVRLRGANLAWASGDVRIDRSDFHAEADSAELDLGTDAGELLGRASVTGGGTDGSGYELNGREIGFTSVDNALNWVQARDSAEAESTEFFIRADTVEFGIADNKIQGGFAWGDVLRPYAVSGTNTIVADSIAIDAPNQQLEELRGFGAARALSVRDSTDDDPDWIAGDTLVARFASTVLTGRFLEQIVATGTAAALYRVYREGGGDLPDINYSRGDQIIATFSPFGIMLVTVHGNADGVHLESIRGNRP